ncbi:hypothetical protein HJG60_008735 [Phyllostomus discolor]|uniref:Uncharacterized protein n=1 Tax=Phyllostomus discolor TaxID=89673 RepID=A0A833YTX7_9CHIR|nr:hypothetical protein HJG60_008735 [Phyllostomus discolor]
MYVDQLTDSTLSTHIYHLRLPGYPLLTNFNNLTLHVYSMVRIVCCTLVLVLFTLETSFFHLQPSSSAYSPSPISTMSLPEYTSPTRPLLPHSNCIHRSAGPPPSALLVLGFCTALVLRPAVLFIIPPPPLLVSLQWEPVFGPCSFSQSLSPVPQAISQLPLFPLPSRCPNLDLQNSVLSPLLLSQIFNYQTFPLGSAAIPFIST